MNRNSKKTSHKTNIEDFIKNPLINHFTFNSFFIFDKSDFIKYFFNLKNKNLIKLTPAELSNLKSISKDIEIKVRILDNNSFILIDKDICRNLKNFFKINNELSDRALFFQKEIINSENRSSCSRNIGGILAHEAGVSCEPEISEKELESDDHYIIIGFDGIWDAMSNCEVVGFIFQKMESQKSKCVQLIAEECRNRWELLNMYK